MDLQNVLKSNFQYEIAKKSATHQTGATEANIYILGATSATQLRQDLKRLATELQLSSEQQKNLNSERRSIFLSLPAGRYIWIMKTIKPMSSTDHHGLLDESAYAWVREQSGSLVAQFKSLSIDKVNVLFSRANEEICRAFVVGLELASYNFLNILKNQKNKNATVYLQAQNSKFKLEQKILATAQTEAASVQLARHLVNLPPNMLNPQSVEEIVKQQLNFPKSVKIEVWNEKKLVEENMNLLLAVGRGSDTPPRMVRISYRPKNARAKKRPLAFVGKGITFDTGGLDLKPASAMRLMKKDMGGAAAVLGLAYWAIHTNYNRSCDFYLALAENSVDAKAMRPSDLYTSRAGYIVEIDNTDAEGRLVLADVMDVAAKQKAENEPEYLVDIATLTGAIKVALGADVAGLFCNDDKLATQLQKAGQISGELNWRMPLVGKYFSVLSSPFADFKNSADGFGGAITAALFLEKFCAGKKWAHLDVYSWNDKSSGALSSSGGSGQPVQSLVAWMKTVV